jgi:small GTP-binding protein
MSSIVSKKLILTGCFGVGKTSLFNQFLYSRFSEKYLTTIGVKVDKKVVKVGDREISLLIWDIAGEVDQDKVPKSYFLGASAIVYVFDLTRPSTWLNIESDIVYVKQIVEDAIVRVVGNKVDLVDDGQVENVKAKIAVQPEILTSAKTGENVEHLFHGIAEELLEKA